MTKHLIMLMALVGLSFIISGCGGAKLAPEVAEIINNQATMYTTRNMHYNIARKGQKLVETTNYQVGFLIPVNSKVTMQSANAKQIVFLYEGNEIILRNTPKYTGVGISEILQQYFSSKKVDLAKFTKDEQKAISNAGLVKGMSKAAVLVSLGTPPAHQTPRLDSDSWKFWKDRWTTFLVTFKNGKVIDNPHAANNNNSGTSVSLISVH